jgi:hypothetical protein
VRVSFASNYLAQLAPYVVEPLAGEMLDGSDYQFVAGPEVV